MSKLAQNISMWALGLGTIGTVLQYSVYTGKPSRARHRAVPGVAAAAIAQPRRVCAAVLGRRGGGEVLVMVMWMRGGG